MAALTLSQRTARYAHLSSEAVWNTVVAAIVFAFVISRVLLVVFNLRSFLQYPLLILALPSLTGLGVLMTAVLMLGYIRWRKLPFLPLLDALAPCAALLWVFLSLGRIFDGTRDGMPLGRAWRSARMEVHPVEFYTLIAAFAIWVSLFRTLRSRSSQTGQTMAAALVSAGVALFVLDFFRLPSDLVPNLPLDPSQIIGVAMILGGATLTFRSEARTTPESGNEPPNAV